MALWPPLGGKDVNGLGNPDPRPARMVCRAPDPDAIPHGQPQRCFCGRSAEIPDFASRRAARQPVPDTSQPADRHTAN